MILQLEKRDGASRLASILSPLLALVLTMIAGAIMFVILGKPPFAALYTYFIEPLSDPWTREQIW